VGRGDEPPAGPVVRPPAVHHGCDTTLHPGHPERSENCDQYLPGRYDLEVIDVYQQPTLAQEEQLIAAPTLIKKLPLPLRKIIGDMSNEARVLIGLDLRPHADRTSGAPGPGRRHER
jgi:KaiB domain